MAPYFNNPAEYQYALVNPDAKEFFRELNKDLVTSNLNDFEINYINTIGTLLGYTEKIMKDVSILFERDALTMSNAAKSRKGFFLSKVTGINIKTEKYDKQGGGVGFGKK